jgi:hypothetical protein
MLMGYSPETTQAAYRIGDSYSNVLTPLLPYFPGDCICPEVCKRCGHWNAYIHDAALLHCLCTGEDTHVAVVDLGRSAAGH